MKSFRPRSEGDGAGSGTPSGRNRERDYRSERRKNDTHASTTDGDAKLYRKGSGRSAQFCYMEHALMENRHGLAVSAMLTVASGTAEREATFPTLDHASLNPGATLGGDKAYGVWRFKQALKEHGITPHMAMG